LYGDNLAFSDVVAPAGNAKERYDGRRERNAKHLHESHTLRDVGAFVKPGRDIRQSRSAMRTSWLAPRQTR
jgi:hypothetical protein